MKKKNLGRVKVGDWLLVRARDPMPDSMREALSKPCRVSRIEGNVIIFENGWSINPKLGDEILGHIRGRNQN